MRIHVVRQVRIEKASTRTEAYQQRGESVSSSVAEKRLVDLKAEFPWLKEVSSVILQQTLRDQKAAFINFFNPKL